MHFTKISSLLAASVAIFGSLALVSTGRTQSENNTLQDPGFEEITNNTLAKWRVISTAPFASLKIVEADPNLVRSGKFAVQLKQEELTATGEKKNGQLYTLDSTPVEPSTVYDLGVWAKGKGSIRIQTFLYKIVDGVESFHSTAYLPTAADSMEGGAGGENDWAQYRARLDTATLPPEVKSIRFAIVASGSWTIDDASVVKTGGEAPVANAPAPAAEVKPISAEETVRPNLITAGMTTKAPQIDGRIENGEYSMLSTGMVDSSANTSYPMPNRFGISYDAQNLYFATSLQLPPGYALKADGKKRDDSSLMADKDVFYFFLRGDDRYEDKGYEGVYLGISANGTLYDAWEKVSWKEAYVKRDTTFDANLKMESRQNNGVWTVEFAMPWKNSGLATPADGAKMLASFGFNLANSRISWQPHPIWFDHFQAFGEILFAERPLDITIPSLGEISRGQLAPDFQLGNSDQTQKPYGLTYVVSTPRMIAGQIGGYVFDVASMVRQEQFIRNQSIYFWEKSGELVPGQNKAESAQSSLKKPDFYVLEVEAKSDGKAVLYQKVPFHYSPPLVASLTPFPSAETIEMKLQMYGARSDEKGAVAIAFKDAAGKTALTKNVAVADDEMVVPVSMSALKAGTYNVALQLTSKAGQSVSSIQETFTKRPTPEWLSNRKGIQALDADWVPAPWKPLTLKNDQVDLWGRTFNFKKGSLLNGINSQGTSIIAPGMSVNYQLAGKQHVIDISEPQFPVKKAGRIEVQQTGKAPHFTLKSRQRIEFDGMDRFDLEITPQGNKKVDRVWIDIPFAKAKLWLATSQEGLHGFAWQSGLVPEGNVSDKSKYSWIWMGDDKVGCTYFVENYKGWLINSQKPRVEVIDNGGQKVLRLLIVNEASDVTAPLKFTFGLHPTPVKPFYENWRDARTQGLTLSEPPTSLTIASPDYWNSAYSKPSPRNWKALHDMVALTHARKQKIYPYIGLLYLSPYDYVKKDFGFMDFDGKPFPPEVLIKKKGEGTKQEDYFYFKEDWHLVPASISTQDWDTREEVRVNPSSTWADYFTDGVDELLEKSNIDGLFVDIDNPMLNLDPKKGLSYRTKDGTEEGTYELYATRDMYKRLYYIFDKRRGPGRKPYLLGHGFAAAAPYMSFWDIAINGEEIKPTKNFEATKLFLQKHLKGNPIAYFGDGETSYDGHAYRAIYGSQFGLPNMYLPQYGYRPELKTAENSREMLSLTFPHNSILWAATTHAPPIYDFWSKVEVPFGLGDAEFFPYWENGVKTDAPNIKVSYWKKKDKNDYLVSLSNWADNDTKVTVTLPEAFSGFKSTSDMESGEKIAVNKSFTINVPAHDLRAFRFSAGQ